MPIAPSEAVNTVAVTIASHACGVAKDFCSSSATNPGAPSSTPSLCSLSLSLSPSSLLPFPSLTCPLHPIASSLRSPFSLAVAPNAQPLNPRLWGLVISGAWSVWCGSNGQGSPNRNVFLVPTSFSATCMSFIWTATLQDLITCMFIAILSSLLWPRE